MAENGNAEKKPAGPGKADIDELLPSDLLDETEVVVFAIKPSLWTVVFLSFRTVVICGVVTVAAVVLRPHLGLGRYAGYTIEICGVVVLARVGYGLLQWLSRSYVLTDRRVIRIRGVFTIDIFQCSLSRIQNTFLSMTLVQRLLQLGNIAFTTAGTGSVEAIWRHCRHPLKVHNQLIAAMNAAARLPASAAKSSSNESGSVCGNGGDTAAV